MGGGTSRRRLVPSHNSHLRDLPRRLKAASRRPRRLAACEWWTGRPGGGTLSSDAPGELVAQPRLCSRLDRLRRPARHLTAARLRPGHRRQEQAGCSSQPVERLPPRPASQPTAVKPRCGPPTAGWRPPPGARVAVGTATTGAFARSSEPAPVWAVQQRDQPGEAAVGVPKQHPVRLQAGSGASRAGIPALLSVLAETQPLDLHG